MKPTILVIFGATGDLMAKKIVPALFNLFKENKLPKKVKIIGFSRRDISESQFRELVKKIVPKASKSFLDLFSYQKGHFDQKESYQQLSKTLLQTDEQWKICSNKLFYLAVPPNFYELICNFLAASGLTIPCGPDEGWTRVIVEKPFGKDLKTAHQLDELLGKFFKEEQIYRIDHYLAKDMLQNILTYRLANNLFNGNWDKSRIDKIEIHLLEKLGVEDRGPFYDSVGALRDVGQNHLLQMLALVTMDRPIDFGADTIRSQRAKILEKVIPGKPSDSFRAQYDGFRKIKGVSQDSETETYFKIRLFIDDEHWQNVPIILESGKRMSEIKKDITVTLKDGNKIVFSLEPDNGIKIISKDGILDFHLRGSQKKSQYVDEYKKLLLDCVTGDQTLFVSTKEVKAMWKVIDPVIEAWQKNLVPLANYKPDSLEILDKAFFTDKKINKKIGIIGLGKMGEGILKRLTEKGWQVVGYNRTPGELSTVNSIKDLVAELPSTRVVWLMVKAGEPTDQMLKESIKYLKKGDIVIDGANSFYKDSIRRHTELKKKGIGFLDVGVSGGPSGARNGPALMIGGDKKVFEKVESLFGDLARENGFQFFEGAGAGHFVKMIHNGIEYGMMQAIGEGFNILKNSSYKLNLKNVTDIYNNGSVIESRLIGWMKKAFELRGENLEKVSGSVAHTGEGEWTVKTAKELGLEAKIIEASFKFRVLSEKNPSYTGKIVSALREQFGGHKVEEK